MIDASRIVNFKSAYLHTYLADILLGYLLVQYKGRSHSLTNLGYVLDSAPKVTATILNAILGKTDKLKRVIKYYFDIILMNECIESANVDIPHLNCFGCTAKPNRWNEELP